MDLKKYKLGDIADIIPGYAFKSTDFLSGENIVIKIKDIEPPFIDVNNADKVGFRPNDKYRLEYGDFVLAMTGATIGKVGVNNTHIPNVYINQRVCKFIPNEGLCDKNYLYYLLNTDAFRNFIYKNIDSSSAQPNIGHPSILKFEHYFPNIEEQKRIGNLLSSLDQKIALNRKINDNLEAMAKQLYDYWFVQFDFPNEEGKPYKSSGGKMVWNDKLKREIPEEWMVEKVSALIEPIERGISYASADLLDDSAMPMINLACFSKSGDYRSGEMKYYSGIMPKNKNVQPMDMLIACTDMTQGADIIGRPILASHEFEQYTFSTDLAALRPKSIAKMYLYYTLRTPFYHKYIRPFASGTNVKHLNIAGVENYIVTVPTDSVQLEFERTIVPVKEKQSKVLNEIALLTKQRDELLPLLMNGQVSVNYHLSDD